MLDPMAALQNFDYKKSLSWYLPRSIAQRNTQVVAATKSKARSTLPPLSQVQYCSGRSPQTPRWHISVAQVHKSIVDPFCNNYCHDEETWSLCRWIEAISWCASVCVDDEVHLGGKRASGIGSRGSLYDRIESMLSQPFFGHCSTCEVLDSSFFKRTRAVVKPVTQGKQLYSSPPAVRLLKEYR